MNEIRLAASVLIKYIPAEHQNRNCVSHDQDSDHVQLVERMCLHAGSGAMIARLEHPSDI